MVAFWWEDWPGTRLRVELVGLGGHGADRGRGDRPDGPSARRSPAGSTCAGSSTRTAGPCRPSPPRCRSPAPRSWSCSSSRWSARAGRCGACPRSPPGRWRWCCPGRIALALYLLLVSVDPPPGSGVNARSGPVAGADFGAALVCIGAWQVLCFVVWRGRPTSRLSSRAARLTCAHALVIGGGLLTFCRGPARARRVDRDRGGRLLRRPPASSSACSSRPTARTSRCCSRSALFAGLSALAGAFTFTRADPEDWVAHASLNALAVSTILHVAVGRRWPFA